MDFTPYFDRSTAAPGEALPGSRYRRCADSEYRSFPGLNASLLKHPTAAESLHDMQNPKPATASMALGTVLHAAVLEPHKLGAEEWEKHFVLCPTKGLDTKAAALCQAENPGKTMITPEILDNARLCREALLWNDEAQKWLHPEGGRHLEAAGFVFDRQRFQCWRKLRVDLLPAAANYLLDVKTTSRHLGDFAQECWKFGYFLQAAWYLDTHRILTGVTLPWFILIAITTEPPFLSRVVILNNRQPGDPLYAESVIGKARQRLGLDDSERLGRAPVLLNSMRQTIACRERGQALTPAVMRNLFPGYEDETPAFEIL